jgi:hypothetical protein
MQTQVRARRAIDHSRNSVQVDTNGSSDLNSPLSLTLDDRVIPPHYEQFNVSFKTTGGPVRPPDP